MKINKDELSFKVKINHNDEWQIINIPLSHLRKTNLNCDESLSMDISEYIYAKDDRFYEYQEELIFDVKDYWQDIVIQTHKFLYPEKY